MAKLNQKRVDILRENQSKIFATAYYNMTVEQQEAVYDKFGGSCSYKYDDKYCCVVGSMLTDEELEAVQHTGDNTSDVLGLCGSHEFFDNKEIEGLVVLQELHDGCFSKLDTDVDYDLFAKALNKLLDTGELPEHE